MMLTSAKKSLTHPLRRNLKSVPHMTLNGIFRDINTRENFISRANYYSTESAASDQVTETAEMTSAAKTTEAKDTATATTTTTTTSPKRSASDARKNLVHQHSDTFSFYSRFLYSARQGTPHLDRVLGTHLKAVEKAENVETLPLTEAQKTQIANLVLHTLLQKSVQPIVFSKWFNSMFYGSVNPSKPQKDTTEGGKYYISKYAKNVLPDIKSLELVCDFYILTNRHKALHRSLKVLYNLYPELFTDPKTFPRLASLIIEHLLSQEMPSKDISKWVVWLLTQFKDISHGHFAPGDRAFCRVLEILTPHLSNPLALRPILRIITEDPTLEISSDLFARIIQAMRRPQHNTVSQMLASEEASEENSSVFNIPIFNVNLIQLIKNHNIPNVRISDLLSVYAKYGGLKSAYHVALTFIQIPEEVQQILERGMDIDTELEALKLGNRNPNLIPWDSRSLVLLLSAASREGDEQKLIDLVEYAKEEFPSVPSLPLKNSMLQAILINDLDRGVEYFENNFVASHSNTLDYEAPLFSSVVKETGNKTTYSILLTHLSEDLMSQHPAVAKFIEHYSKIDSALDMKAKQSTLHRFQEMHIRSNRRAKRIGQKENKEEEVKEEQV
eukprot:CAMPEP_0117446064 /NCGR_PEP_ID=MMETSP0759-20121206/6133_1 /TAXON_ID=63605 /ORGANISM="Percolomonas cosmopolitus, Strain WS" /LENGTH=613 /DNA_ID=CAMNT_0005238289 /DNA_START=26 /DNA_END=1867 /DNA_ORIENTATION=-